MKKQILILFLLSSTAFAGYIPMSKGVAEKSLTMTRPQWTDLCIADRRKIYCGGKKCDAGVEYGWYKLCWNYYPKMQYYAYRKKK